MHAKITVPIVLLGGDRSPAHLGERLDALERTLPHAERVVLGRQGHAANVFTPGKLADVISELADRVLH
jgi:pimeloyl-ACP methyl ester carboxylesterase